MKKILVPVADGSEEMEVVIIVDCLRRAGLTVTCASINEHIAVGSRDVRIVADALWDDCESSEYDAIVLPGGNAGTAMLMRHAGVLSTIREFVAGNKLVAAICAAPQVLQAAGVLSGKRVTCHPAVREAITQAELCDDRVVIDGGLVTSQGPGTSMEFALALIALLCGAAKAEEVSRGLVLHPATSLLPASATP